jgi:hypothetical protein
MKKYYGKFFIFHLFVDKYIYKKSNGYIAYKTQ